MGLGEYHRKRNFGLTPEPRGEEKSDGGRSFCIQKHAARQLHYDFRLEMEGVLKSWAVPKGPSFDPKDKRLAMQTEDHPVDYGDFEGIIPEGEYGGGTVLLWDHGTWEPIEDPHQGLRKGSLKFRLDGAKLQGRWALVRIKGRDTRDDKTWLLIKEKDDQVREASEFSVVEERPESVATGRSLEEIAAQRDRVWHSNRDRPEKTQRLSARAAKAPRAKPSSSAPPRGKDFAERAAGIPGARAAAFPRTVSPQLATLVSQAPGGDEWLHEMKFDGYRILARVENGRATLLSRNGKDWTANFPGVARAVADLPVRQAVLDGEVAALLPSGATSFQALQNALNASAPSEIVYFVFDLLHLDGHDLSQAPLEERKAALQDVLGPPAGRARILRYSDHVVGTGPRFFAEACRLHVEGIVSKRRDATYQAGRSRSWLKMKCLARQEFVIGGYTDPEGARTGIGALLLGVYEDGRLRFSGKVGTGFTQKVLDDLTRRLGPLERKSSPFEQARIPGVTRAHWVEPELVAEVAFTEWTSDGRLRHPSFQGLREDKKAQDVVRERPGPTEDVKKEPQGAPPAEPVVRRRGRASKSREEGGETEVAGVRLTHPDRVLYPDQGLTKRALALFYEEIADRILPHVLGRPLTLVRCPEGMAHPCFYMKHSGVWAPPALRRVDIQEKTKVGEYLVADDLAGVISLVQIGILEIHTWNSIADDVEHPNRIVFDLDPGPRVTWDRVVETARRLRRDLEAFALESWVKTTGGKGLHVVAPLRPPASWDDSFAFTRAISERLEKEQPEAYTTAMPKERRQGRILIDYLRNNRGNTSVAAYSTRAREGAPVSTPVAWDELALVRPDQYTVANVRERLSKSAKDPWAGYFKAKQRLTAAAKRAFGIGARS